MWVGAEITLIYILGFGIEAAASCNWDWLEIISNGEQVGKYCGKGDDLPGSIQIHDGPVEIIFQSDISTSDIGFSLSFTIIEPE